MALHRCCFIPISPTAMCLPPLASVFAANWALPHTVLPIPSAMEPGANLAWGRHLNRHAGHLHRAAPADRGQGWGSVVVPSFHQSTLAPVGVPA